MNRFRSAKNKFGVSLTLAVMLVISIVLPSSVASASAPVTVTFNYTGGVQTWTVPANVTQVTIDAFGAQGGNEAAQGGLGGEATATFTVTPGETLTIVVGGIGHSPFNGEDASGGYNGGGNGGAPYNLPLTYSGSGGGGASDVRRGGTDLAHRIIVAGGGGGAADVFGPDGSGYGGAGGGLTGGTGNSAYILYAPSGGAGGNQDGSTGSGQLGIGSNGADNTSTLFNGVGSGGGGGGYYGGAGGSAGTGGGGGSGYGPVGTVFATGVNEGNGVVTITYMVDNTPPTASAGGPYLVAINASIALDGSGSTDPEGDALTETWTANGGTVSGNTYTAGSQAGIFDVCLTVNDGDLDSAPDCTIIVVYDPSAGFVTGGGWIDSPAGAYVADPSMTGKATFGFVAKYKKGANVPDGNTEFQFKASDLNFHSTSYEWLVVAGNMAQFKGEGTINGQGSYKFMITADDDNPDTFRIKIWDENGTVYDNGSQQSLGGGSIVVHSK